ncbi:MAG: stage V sporulation protein AD [Oscillospiraceae bacterium]|nr:stage V sporulation protein AD [Oscillospiraceae bacterium]
MAKKLGRSTVRLEKCPAILSSAAVGSKKEGEGPLARYFDHIAADAYFGEESWERAEGRLQQLALQGALSKGGFAPEEIDFLFAGDLLNQCVGSSYGLRDFGIPFLGLYGACSTMAESLIMASLFVECGLAKRAAAVTSSHFCSAERQFRFPLEYGGQRPPTSQWTATASGCAIVGEGKGIAVRHLTAGIIRDLGITDANNMGAAMAPAAASTLTAFFGDTNTHPADYDLILTGDLGQVGRDLLFELLEKENIRISDRHNDCGLMLYDREKQDVHAGGSGCGCSASVLCGAILRQMEENKYQDVLFMATGALMSTTMVQQGESIPGVAHLVHLSVKQPGKEERSC